MRTSTSIVMSSAAAWGRVGPAAAPDLFSRKLLDPQNAAARSERDGRDEYPAPRHSKRIVYCTSRHAMLVQRVTNLLDRAASKKACRIRVLTGHAVGAE